MSDAKSNEYFDLIPTWSLGKEVTFYTHNDSINGRIPILKLNSWNDFIALLEQPFFKNNESDLIFRGQRRYDWGLVPNIARISGGIFDKDLYQRQLNNFRKAIRGRIKDNVLILDNSEESDNELWAIGQHYGLNTPLLDWTISPYVALFFAFSQKDNSSEKPNDYRVVYIANKKLLSDAGIEFVEPKIDMYGRLVNQAGLFIKFKEGKSLEGEVYDYLSTNDEVDVLEEVDLENELAKHLCKIYIKNDAKEQHHCVMSLRKMNIHHASLFPDLAGAAEYCNMLSESEDVKNKNDNPLMAGNVISTQIDNSNLFRENYEMDSLIGLLKKYFVTAEAQELSYDVIKIFNENKSIDWFLKDNVKAVLSLSWKRIFLSHNLDKSKFDPCIKDLFEYFRNYDI